MIENLYHIFLTNKITLSDIDNTKSTRTLAAPIMLTTNLIQNFGSHQGRLTISAHYQDHSRNIEDSFQPK